MGKLVLIGLLTLSVFADNMTLKNDCLSCHTMQQIPNDLVYRRYLMKYSTQEKIEGAIANYLKNPQKVNSIMPPQFFLKFPMKKFQVIDDARLKSNISAYIETFDVKKKLILERE